VLAAASLALPAPRAPDEPDARVRFEAARVRAESLSAAVEAALPEPLLPDLPEVVVAREPVPEPALEEVGEAREEEPRDLLPHDLPLSAAPRRPRPRAPAPSPAPPPATATPRASPPSAARPASAPDAPAAAPLRLVHAPAAVYPSEAWRRGIEGTALVRIVVATSGLVTEVRLLRSSGSPILDADAVARARLHRYAPIPSPRVENLPVRYRLD
jgi:protein TonB